MITEKELRECIDIIKTTIQSVKQEGKVKRWVEFFGIPDFYVLYMDHYLYLYSYMLSVYMYVLYMCISETLFYNIIVCKMK